jgi:hypothetical protein
MATTIASPSQNAVAVGAHTLENSVREKPSKQAANGVKPAFLATDSILLANSALSEVKANRASALVPDRIGGARNSAALLSML